MTRAIISVNEYEKMMIAAADKLAQAQDARRDIATVLREAVQQIEYLHAKFNTTGSGEAVLSRARAVLAKSQA